jgi:hypothetical protein
MKRLCLIPSIVGATGLLFAGVIAGRAASLNSDFLEQIRANFTAWDIDHNGELSPGEIELVVANPQVRGQSAAAAVALRRAVRKRIYQLPPLTLDNIVRCASSNERGSGRLPDFESLYESALDRIGKARRDLFPSGKPSLDDLHQGRLGDCYCLAPLGAMIHRNPQDVVNMFRIDPEGRVIVVFGGVVPVGVDPLSDGELAVTAADADHGAWVKLYEKAVGTYRAPTKATQSHPTPLSVVAKGGAAGDILELLTGHAVRRFFCSPFRDPATRQDRRNILLVELRALLRDAVRDKRLICGGTSSGVKVPGISGLHAYAVLDYDAAKDEVVLWNPTGATFRPKGPDGLEYGYSMSHGQFRVPLVELVQFFGGFSFETEQPSKG